MIQVIWREAWGCSKFGETRNSCTWVLSDFSSNLHFVDEFKGGLFLKELYYLGTNFNCLAYFYFYFYTSDIEKEI